MVRNTSTTSGLAQDLKDATDKLKCLRSAGSTDRANLTEQAAVEEKIANIEQNLSKALEARTLRYKGHQARLEILREKKAEEISAKRDFDGSLIRSETSGSRKALAAQKKYENITKQRRTLESELIDIEKEVHTRIGFNFNTAIKVPDNTDGERTENIHEAAKYLVNLAVDQSDEKWYEYTMVRFQGSLPSLY